MVDTAHGHSKGVLDGVAAIRRLSNATQIVAGNVATGDAAAALIEAGADAIKVGIGPGSICTTRIVAGVGVPQLTAILEVAARCRPKGVPVIADGGIRSSGDLAKAIAAGADCVMLGSMFAGCEEAPGEVFLYQGRSYKSYRGMGSLGAMARGSADRYFQQEVRDSLKLVPRASRAGCPIADRSPASSTSWSAACVPPWAILAMRDLRAMQRGCRFLRVSQAGWRESHVHDVAITREAPNYRQDI